MGTEIAQLHIMFFPFMATGHMIPVLDMVKLFGLRGVRATIVTTPLNLLRISKTVQRTKDLGVDVDVKLIEFPCTAAGLPEGFENLDAITDNETEMTAKFLQGASMLREPLELLLQESEPDCLVADMFFPWTSDSAAKFGIPRLAFHGSSFFAMCTLNCVAMHEPHKKVSSVSEPFVVPGLPGDIELTRSQLPDFMDQPGAENYIAKVMKDAGDAELKSYGVVFNSFYELEATYVDYYREVMGSRAWHIGPVLLCNRDPEDKTSRGRQASMDEQECLKWLNSKKPNSIVYICFGSLAGLDSAQLMEIAAGLEASRQEFIWVVRKDREDRKEKELDWLPEGYEKRMEGKGLIIRGWAPQVLILEHEAVGGFVTHCGWNSILEGVTAGVPMVTWPIFAEQFFNEKIVTQVLNTGVHVGVQKWTKQFTCIEEFVKRERIAKAVEEIMVGDVAEEMRRKAKALGEMARRAVEKEGSSYSDLNALIEELKLLAVQAKILDS